MTGRWTAKDVPDLSGKTIVVSGGNSGIGYQAALELARKGARVVLACRDSVKAVRTVEAIRGTHPGAHVESMELDLASLVSVRDFAKAFLERHDALHVLCNNAGVMAIPRRVTADGFEMQLGTNHLGHFALTGLLLDRLLATDGARVVTVASTAHRPGRINFDDLQSERSYGKWRAYGQSKLANVKRHPTIGDDVTIYPNATILGGNSIVGKGCIIGANVWLAESVGPYTKVRIEPPQLQLIRKEDRTDAHEWEI